MVLLPPVEAVDAMALETLPGFLQSPWQAISDVR